MALIKTIFREYDIRGLAHVEGELTPENVRCIVNAFLAYKPNEKTLIVGSDYRSSSDEFREITIAAALKAGREVIDIGTVTTPMFYFAQYHWKVPAGIMITASHNPSEWNGFKLADGFSSTLTADGIRAVRDLALTNAAPEASPGGERRTFDVSEPYIDAIVSRLQFGKRRMKVVIDCGNGTASFIAPRVFEKLNVDIVPLFCEPDFTFPNHFPNPSNLEAREAAKAAVRSNRADLALLFDGDADRLGVVDDQGQDVWSDQVVLLLALRLLEAGKSAKVVYDVKSTQALEDVLPGKGGVPIMWKTGHSHIKQKSKEIGADLAGERSGHIFIFDRWFGFDDAVFAGAYFLEYLSQSDQSLSERMARLPHYITSPEIHAECADAVKYDVVERLTRDFKKDFDRVIDINGARVVFPDGWGLVRASSNLPELVFVFEAKSEDRLRQIHRIFRERCEKYPEISRKWENDVYAETEVAK